MKSNDISSKYVKYIEGEWYYNPMMEMHGTGRKWRYTKLKYTEISKGGKDGSFYKMEFDEGITADGVHEVFKFPLKQSNRRYEAQMKHIEFKKIRVVTASNKYGL